MSKADEIFISNCTDIIEHGFSDDNLDVRPRWSDGTPAHTIKRFGVVNRYDLRDEFPIITLKKTAYKSCIDEILWIWQKKSNRVCDLNSSIWDLWVGKDGTIGKAYGYQLAKKSDYTEGVFDQVDYILHTLKHNPQSRRIIANMYNHAELNEMNLYPCAYSLTLNVSGNILNGILNQRSQDMAVASNWNVVQYSVLMKMFAHASGLTAGELVHVVADAHIYDRHIPMVKELLKQKIFKAPTFKINRSVNDFYDFSVNDFSLSEYNYSSFNYKFEVAK